MATRGVEMSMVEWKHWETGNKDDWDVEAETAKVAAAVTEKDLTIVAKSIGTLVTMNYIQKFASTLPKKVILLGLPLNDTYGEWQQLYLDVLKNNPNLDITILQNTTDPHGSYRQIVNFLKPLDRDIPIIETPRDDHQYPFYDNIYQLL